MASLVLIGLVLDLVGVLLLGFDVVHVQKRLRDSSKEVLSKVHTVFEEADAAGENLNEIAFDHRYFDWDEGQVVYMDGTFDERAARESQKALSQTISSISRGMGRLAEIALAGADAQEATANLSLWRTIIGLVFVITGFALQIIGQLDMIS